MKKLALILFLILSFHSSQQLLAQDDADFQTITQLINAQSESWNQGDIDGFMQSYWNSPKLQFIGGSGITYGWKATLENYKKRYPNKAAMGQLEFEILDMTKRSRKVISVVGEYTVTRQSDELNGHFMLVWQKKKNEWVIVADCTSAAP